MSSGEQDSSEVISVPTSPPQATGVVVDDDMQKNELPESPKKPASNQEPDRPSSPIPTTPQSDAFEDNNVPNLNSKIISQKTAHEDTGHFFGMKKKGYMPQHDITDDYEQRFPEDPIFEETGPNARVWRTYLVESAAFDENMIGEARDGLDAMLVFAGLFSAVVTSFLVQTSQNLQLDSTDVTASLLSELVAVQRAAATGGNISAVPPSTLVLGSDFHADPVDVWINGLWLVSLTLALVIALAAVLVKQWLHHYVAIPSGPPKEKSHIRQFRFAGLEKWQVLSIIGLLPVIMHVSLGLFLIGLPLCDLKHPPHLQPTVSLSDTTH
ncbi:hypothetical protein FB446DRAFT_786532 [Lentinula raphanica]|nr:hypothetical protein FB446DRAFT_786532 [Lentinula raphanica]